MVEVSESVTSMATKTSVNFSGLKDSWEELSEGIRRILLMMLGEWYIFALIDLGEEYKRAYRNQRAIDCTVAVIDVSTSRDKGHYWNKPKELRLQSYLSHRRVLYSGFRFPKLERLIVQSITLGVTPRWKSRRRPDFGVTDLSKLDISLDEGIKINLARSFPKLRILVVTNFESEGRAWPAFAHPSLSMICATEHWLYGTIKPNMPTLAEPWKLPKLKHVHYLHDTEYSYFY